MSNDVEGNCGTMPELTPQQRKEAIKLIQTRIDPDIHFLLSELNTLKAENAKMVEAGFREGIRMGRATCGVQTPQPITDRMWHLSEARKGLE